VNSKFLLTCIPPPPLPSPPSSQNTRHASQLSHLVTDIGRKRHVGGIGSAHGEYTLGGILGVEPAVQHLAYEYQQVGTSHSEQAGPKSNSQQLDAIPQRCTCRSATLGILTKIEMQFEVIVCKLATRPTSCPCTHPTKLFQTGLLPTTPRVFTSF
jgi:hypothetical protein